MGLQNSGPRRRIAPKFSCGDRDPVQRKLRPKAVNLAFPPRSITVLSPFQVAMDNLSREEIGQASRDLVEFPPDNGRGPSSEIFGQRSIGGELGNDKAKLESVVRAQVLDDIGVSQSPPELDLALERPQMVHIDQVLADDRLVTPGGLGHHAKAACRLKA